MANNGVSNIVFSAVTHTQAANNTYLFGTSGVRILAIEMAVDRDPQGYDTNWLFLFFCAPI